MYVELFLDIDKRIKGTTNNFNQIVKWTNSRFVDEDLKKIVKDGIEELKADHKKILLELIKLNDYSEQNTET